MTQPLALVFYEKLLPGTQLVNKLQDLRYRVQTVHRVDLLQDCAEQERPMVVLADLESSQGSVCSAIARLRQDPATGHVPVIGFCRDSAPEMIEAAQKAGVTLCVTETAALAQLPQLLEQALHLE